MRIENCNNYTFEARSYNEDASPEEIQALKDRVFIYEDQIILYREIPIVSQFSINVCFDQVAELSKQFDKCGLIIDVSETKPPDAKTRRTINKRFGRIEEDIDHVAFSTGKNILLNALVKFVLFRTNLDSFTINKTIEEASISAKKIVHA